MMGRSVEKLNNKIISLLKQNNYQISGFAKDITTMIGKPINACIKVGATLKIMEKEGIITKTKGKPPIYRLNIEKHERDNKVINFVLINKEEVLLDDLKNKFIELINNSGGELRATIAQIGYMLLPGNIKLNDVNKIVRMIINKCEQEIEMWQAGGGGYYYSLNLMNTPYNENFPEYTFHKEKEIFLNLLKDCSSPRTQVSLSKYLHVSQDIFIQIVKSLEKSGLIYKTKNISKPSEPFTYILSQKVELARNKIEKYQKTLIGVIKEYNGKLKTPYWRLSDDMKMEGDDNYFISLVLDDGERSGLWKVEECDGHGVIITLMKTGEDLPLEGETVSEKITKTLLQLGKLIVQYRDEITSQTEDLINENELLRSENKKLTESFEKVSKILGGALI